MAFSAHSGSSFFGRLRWDETGHASIADDSNGRNKLFGACSVIQFPVLSLAKGLFLCATCPSAFSNFLAHRNRDSDTVGPGAIENADGVTTGS
ncbi:MAG: hypothetical protein WA634_00710 [Silvibacterium sp.]